LPGNFCQREQEKEENVKEREKSTEKGQNLSRSGKKGQKMHEKYILAYCGREKHVFAVNILVPM
jgi:hypothetical protein